VLDLGAGAGRHSLHLQSLGHRVTAVDTSPGAVEVCRARGIGDVLLADLTKLVDKRTWDTILLMCGNSRTLRGLGAHTTDPDAPEEEGIARRDPDRRFCRSNER
jgi:SAM-dependent methyltransferase